MKKQIIILITGCLFSVTLFSQTEIGAEYQYSIGKSFNSQQAGAIYEGFSNTGKTSWHLGLSYNFSSSYNGKSSALQGNWNINAGVRYGFSYGTDGNLLGGLRLSYGFGKENILVPSLELGYHYTFKNFGPGAYTTPSLGIGYVVPVKSNEKEEENFEGTIFNLRIAAGYRF